MQICLIRHGETDWNAVRRMQGREDIPLNQKGREQAALCGQALKKAGHNWKAVFTSPLKRAKETAEIIAGILGINEIYEDADLVERDFGKASGLTYDEAKALYPDGIWEGVESDEAMRDRMCLAVARCAEKTGGDILIVSHGGSINALLAEASGNTVGTGKTTLKNACLNLFTYKNKRLEIVFYNKGYDEL